MPAKNKTQITFHVSPREREALDQLADGNRSAYLRALIRQDAEQRGVLWPDDTRDTRGKYKRK